MGINTDLYSKEDQQEEKSKATATNLQLKSKAVESPEILLSVKHECKERECFSDLIPLGQKALVAV